MVISMLVHAIILKSTTGTSYCYIDNFFKFILCHTKISPLTLFAHSDIFCASDLMSQRFDFICRFLHCKNNLVEQAIKQYFNIKRTFHYHLPKAKVLQPVSFSVWHLSKANEP